MGRPRIDFSTLLEWEVINGREDERVLKRFKCIRQRDGQTTMCLHLDKDKDPAICRSHGERLPIWLLKQCPLAYVNEIMGKVMKQVAGKGSDNGKL